MDPMLKRLLRHDRKAAAKLARFLAELDTAAQVGRTSPPPRTHRASFGAAR
jgi:hypothetical protein